MQKIILFIACLFWVFIVKAQPNITGAEYFINSDPGFGNAKPIAITPAPNLININFPADITNAIEGINSLYLRSRDANGRWSITNRFLFVKAALQTGTPNIAGAEYFFDTDPGFGKASAVPLTPGTDLSNISFSANMTALDVGIHYLFIRSRAANGRWGSTNSFLFVKVALQTGTPNITGAEYFIDTDPGFGNGAPVALNPATNLPDFIMNVNITGIAAGNHHLYLRSRDAAGKWSITNTFIFTITTVTPTPLIAVNSITNKTMCGATQFKVAYLATGTYNAGNSFAVQLSNAAGNFASPQVIGSITGPLSGLINCTIPLQIPNGSAYRVRVVSTSPVVTGLTSDTVFTLYTQPRFADTLAPIVCLGETVNLNTVFNTADFTASWDAPNPALAPAGTYQLITSNTPLCKDTAVVTVQQDIARWTGATSSDWHTAANWSTGRVPNEKTHVIVPGGTANPCIISTTDAKAASIQLRSGAVLQAINGRLSEVSGKCTVLPVN